MNCFQKTNKQIAQAWRDIDWKTKMRTAVGFILFFGYLLGGVSVIAAGGEALDLSPHTTAGFIYIVVATLSLIAFGAYLYAVWENCTSDI